MQTFTIGETPPEVIAAALPHKYPMELNRGDMQTLLWALGAAWEAWSGDAAEAEVADAAISLRGSILETLGIEEV